jgi:2,3-dihydroxybenzoate decarboxylase
VRSATTTNDQLAAIIAAHPDRYAGLAALPMQDPAAATAELERAVRQLGLSGALVNGYSCLGDRDTGLYLDDPSYIPFWERVADLDVPFYLHPRDPLPGQQRIYAGRPELLGAAWAFGAETSAHALRLITSGLFDRLPTLKIVLGHLGETLPFAISRTAARLRDHDLRLDDRVDAYFKRNFWVTTSGHFDTLALTAAIACLGADRVLFALDHPFADEEEGARWFDALHLAPADRHSIGRANAERLFRLREAQSAGGSEPAGRGEPAHGAAR